MSSDPTLAALQRAPGMPAPQAPAALPLRVERVRTFDTPEFAGITFLEVVSKSALNKVSGMPFGWSINAYRGCSHACSYCAGGETPILMADGRTRALADLRVGDEVYGTRGRGPHRRYVTTRVLDHWSTVKPAHRLVLEDGTELIASGDHRFLTDHGWKHVSGRDGLEVARDALVGTGRFASPPKHDAQYQLGYLCGMVRGDGSLGDGDRFRLALLDVEALDRTREFLLDHGVATDRFRLQEATGRRRRLEAIRSLTPHGARRIAQLLAWPPMSTQDWCKGFLAGVFDAAGSHRGDVLRIFNSDPAVIRRTVACLERFGLASAVEAEPACQVVRLTGGLAEHLRFLHLTDPAITSRRTIAGQAVPRGAALGVVAVEPLGLDLPLYDITTGTGDFIADGVVSHNCFARPTHAYLNLDPLRDFERTIVVKTNVAEVLRREVARRTWKGEHVAMGTNTDPYQRAEGRYRLMPGIVGALAEGLTPFSILTKGTLITRDIAVLQAAAQQVPVSAAMTIGMLDEVVWRETEPGTPSPQARLAAVRKLNDAGIPTGVMLAPIMPGLNDDREQLAALVDAIADAGATHITPIVLHLRPKVREVFWPWLREFHPELVDRYDRLYRGAQALPRYRTPIEEFVKQRRKEAWTRRGGPPPAVGGWRGGTPPGPDTPPGTDVPTGHPSPVTADPVAARRAQGPFMSRPRRPAPAPDPGGEQLSLL